MERFSLICPWPSSDISCSKQYLVPSMLMSHPPKDIIKLVAYAFSFSEIYFWSNSAQLLSPTGSAVLSVVHWKITKPNYPPIIQNFARFYISSDTGSSLVLWYHLSSAEVIFLSENRVVGEVEVPVEFFHDTFEVTPACVVRNQLALIALTHSMRNEFCWLKNMTCEVSFLCPVYSRGGAVEYCRNHRAQCCKQEECPHFFRSLSCWSLLNRLSFAFGLLLHRIAEFRSTSLLLGLRLTVER